MPTEKPRASRRNFVKAAYIAPVIITLAVSPAFAKPGSVKDPKDPKPPKDPKDPKPPKDPT